MRSASLKIPRPAITDFEQEPKFQQSALKLYWARLHAHNLSAGWEGLVEKHFEAATGEQTQLPYPIHQYLLAPPVPFDMPLLIGDCIRNMRSALDYLVSEMARARGLPDNNTIFPFSDTAAGLKGSFNEPLPGDEHRKGRKAGALYNLSREYPNLKNVILERIKPYDAANGADPFGAMLRRIVTSDNVDKHRFMTLATQRVGAENIITNRGGFVSSIGGGMQIIGNAISFGPDTKLDKESDFSIDVTFVEPTRLARRPVMSTLVEGCNAVAQVIEIFRNEFDPTPAG